VTTFHDTTVTILKHVLDEQTRDLTLFQHRLERADAGASPDAVQKFRDQITELTTVAGDFRWLVTLALAANAADAAGLPAEITLDARTTVADVATEAFVDVADAERYAQRDEYVNATGDLIGAMGRHSSTHGTTAVYDAADPHDAVLARQARTEYVDYAEAEDVREIEREMAIEAGDDSELDRQVAEDDARFERAVWLLKQEAESEAAQEAWIGQRETAVDEALDARDAESEA